jgi:hypothetical protein
MRETVLVFIMVLLVIAGCSIAGCSSLPFSGTPAPTETHKIIDVGITGQENPNTVPRYRFEETAAGIFSDDSIAKWNDAPVNESQAAISPVKQIKFIRGTDLDENGDAASWIFIVEHGDQLSMVTYNSQGMNVLSSPGTIKRAEIFTDKILSPRDLFARNHAEILQSSPSGTPAVRELSLVGGNYTLKITTPEKPRVLIFDAITGVLISSND